MAVTPRPMRATTRRLHVQQALANGERQASADIAALLDRQFRTLKRELRRANLRKRMEKASHTGAPADALYKDDGWAAWVAAFTLALRQGLKPMVLALLAVEAQYWASHGRRYQEPDADALIGQYETRTHRPLSQIADDTRAWVLAAVTAWYASGETLPDLLDRLQQYFAPDRAEMIARTESAYAAAQVALDAMVQQGVNQWNLDLAPEENGFPCPICLEIADANPHGLGDELPPYHPNDRCGVTYLMDWGD